FKEQKEKEKQDKKKKIIQDTPKEKEFINSFLIKSGKKKLEKIDKFLQFEIYEEKNLRQLIYLLLLSNYSKKRRTLIVIRASSSAGKNYIVSNILPLFPKEDIEEYTSSTASVFNYDDLGGKKILYLKEMRENESTEEVLKAMYDGARVHKETTRVDGRMIVVNHFLDDVGIITTLSYGELQIDVINRAWVLTINEKQDQTIGIMKDKRTKKKDNIKRSLQKTKKFEEAKLISKTYKYLDWDLEVHIPYIERLEVLFPENPAIHLRRDDDKLYDLIEILALFNQKIREIVKIGENKFIFANYEDLELALKVGQEIFSNQLFHIDEIKKAILNAFDNKDTYSITEMTQYLKTEFGTERKTIGRKLFALGDEGYLMAVKENK
ncbi:hypothetical protein LCGC14_2530020, partial [marine sediment metagenome]